MTPGTLAGIALALAFGVLWVSRPWWAVLTYALLGALPLFTAFAMSGDRVTQGLLPVSVMASVFLALWAAHIARPRTAALPFERTLLWFLGASVLSLVSGYLSIDPAIDASRVKLAVSVGQLFLIAWPIASAVVISRSLDTVDDASRLVRVLTWGAIPSVAFPFLPPAWREYVSWSVYFALAAGPFCIVRALDERSMWRRAVLLVVPAMPLVHGLMTGKAFLYGFVGLSALAIAMVRARALVVAGAVVAAGVLLASATFTGRALPGPVRQLVATERAQGSWGGRAGRVALAVDTIGVWSGHPVLGVGPGNNWPYMHHYSVIDTPHNQYLHTLLEQGLVGLVLLLLFIAQAARMGWRVYREAATPEIEALALGWVGYFAGMVGGCMTGDFMFHSIRNGGLELFSGFYLHWVLLGLLIALVRLNEDAHSESLEAVA